MGSGRFHGPSVEATSPDIDGDGGAGRGALRRRNSFLFVAAGSVSVRDG